MEMARLNFKYVLIDTTTRPPVQLPEDYRYKLESRMATTEHPVPEITYKVQNPPTDAYKCEFTVQSSDTDLNKHTNNTTYIRFCWDTVAKAIREGKVLWMKGGLEAYRVMRMNIFYARECKEGDVLAVSMRRNGNTPQWLHFVFKLGNRDIFHGSMEFKHKSTLTSAKL